MPAPLWTGCDNCLSLDRVAADYSPSTPAPASSMGGGWIPSMARKLSCGPSPSIGILHVDDDRLADPELLPEDPLGQRVLDELLDRPAQRPGTELGVVALLGQERPGRRRELEADALVRQLRDGPLHQQVDDLGDLGSESSWKTMTSSIRFRNSGRKCDLSASLTFAFICSWVTASEVWANPRASCAGRRCRGSTS